MKAVVLHSNKQLIIEDFAINSPNPNECQIKIAATGVCSSDIFRSFDNGAYFYPLIMGHELSGEVVAIGENVKNIKVGDNVAVYPLIPCQNCSFCLNRAFVQCKNYDYYGSRRHGGFSEFLNVNEWNLIPLPFSVKLDRAAALEPLSVCIHAIKKCGLFGKNIQQSYENKINVAILGAGFLGLLCAKLLNWIDPQISVTLIDRNKFKLDQNKCEFQNNICLENSEEWEKYLTRNSNQFSHVIESCGSPDTFRYTIQIAQPGGTIVWMGNIYSDLEIPKKMVSSILRKELVIKGTWNSNYDPEIPDNDWYDAINILKSGFDFENLISEKISLNELPLKLKQLFSHKSRESEFNTIKIFVIPSMSEERSCN
ncbi:alcohol dehydrogenase catalytic domain-containing protein [Pigmentibacter ruber]|uniref:alcohol dehydrogenase catalytic domain-containing protein n=1 Tax=Pigmentibacter ruber TaxID=2683196 RepID=UPI00131C97D7|nr:alcohol dehydrogenase catalytic domain-containing protein [Pigmentibacter ruber]